MTDKQRARIWERSAMEMAVKVTELQSVIDELRLRITELEMASENREYERMEGYD